jgi:hypothetical protein
VDRRSLSRAFAACLAAGVAAGCSGGDADPEPIATADPADDATETPDPDPDAPDDGDEDADGDGDAGEANEDPPAASDPAVIPDDASAIDDAYVQAVLDGLDAALGEAGVAAADAGGAFDEATSAALFSAYTPELHGDVTDTWERFVLPTLVDDPAPPTSTVTEVLTATPTCIDLTATRDLSPLGVEDGAAPEDWRIVVLPAPEITPPNATAWRMRVETGASEGQVDDACAELGS